MKPISPLADRRDAIGAGVYAIYYAGSFPAYRAIAEANKNGLFEMPIYVGKAIPKGGRKGGIKQGAAIKDPALRKRLAIHASTIEEVPSLDLDDFYFRCLTVDDIWIPLGENMLIEAFKPLWNMVIDGFGNKTPGKRRKDQNRSSWDTLHPGRRYVDKLGLGIGATTADQLTEKIQAFFEGRYVPKEPVELSEETSSEYEA
jgi:hypothetical protein